MIGTSGNVEKQLETTMAFYSIEKGDINYVSGEFMSCGNPLQIRR